jgi:lycopene cyclase domain-containing protein
MTALAVFVYYAVIITFESLVRHGAKSFGNRFHWTLLIVSSVALAGYGLLYFSPEWIASIPYMYLAFDLLFFILALVLLPKFHRRYRAGIVRAMLFLLPVAFLNEIAALRLGLWHFPATADLVGRVSVQGTRIPLEEVAFFLIVPTVILAFYVYLFDDSGANR